MQVMLQQTRKTVARIVKSVEHEQSTHAENAFGLRHAAAIVLADLVVGESYCSVEIVDRSNARSVDPLSTTLCF